MTSPKNVTGPKIMTIKADHRNPTLEGTPLVCGGKDDDRSYRRECWLYDPQVKEWREGGQSKEARDWVQLENILGVHS